MANILETLTKEQYEKIKIVELEKNTILFREEEICESIGVILEGEMIISSYSYKGTELIYNHLFKEALVLLQHFKYLGEIFKAALETRIYPGI